MLKKLEAGKTKVDRNSKERTKRQVLQPAQIKIIMVVDITSSLV